MATVADLLSTKSPFSGDFALRPVLEELARAPIQDTLRDLRAEINHGLVVMESYRRLHVLISTLYHQSSITLAESEVLREECNQAFHEARKRLIDEDAEEDGNVLREPGLPQGRLLDPN